METALQNTEHKTDAKPSAKINRRPRLSLVRAFSRDRSGATALEFSIIFGPLMLILFGTFEVGLTYMASRMLNSGTDQVARMIRTGQVRANTFTPQQFREELCRKGTMFLFNCGNLHIDVKEVGGFTNQPVPQNPDGSIDTSNMGFAPGGRLTINVVRVYYEWPQLLNWAPWGVDEWSSSKRLLVGTSAFMNEPY